MGKKKSQLSMRSTREKDDRRRELTKLRNRKYREKLKNNPEKMEKIREQTKIRSKRRDDRERKKRESNIAYKRTCQDIWRRRKELKRLNSTGNISWEEFQASAHLIANPATLAQKKRRAKEAKNLKTAMKAMTAENLQLRKRNKSLKVQLARKKARLSQDKQSEQASVSTPIKNTSQKKHLKLIAQKLLKKVNNNALSRKRSQRVIWRFRTEQFLASDDVSKLIPGSTIIDKRIINSERKFKQRKGTRVTKRVLHRRMIDTYVDFKKVYANFPYSFKTFCQFRPIYILTSKRGTKKEKCICVYHSNVKRKLQSLNKFCTSNGYTDLVIENEEELTKITLCEQGDSDFAAHACINRTCPKCGPESLFQHYAAVLGNQILSEHTIPWTRWSMVERIKYNKKSKTSEPRRYNEIEKQVSSFQELVCETVKDMKTFAMHTFKMRWQRKEFQKLKDNLPTDHVIFVMDFSENVQLEFSEETIASHAKASGLTVFPVAVYQHFEDKVQMESVVIISDDLQHDSNSVRKFTDVVMEHMKFEYPEKKLKTVHRYSDNCSAQFKSRHTLRDISMFRQTYGCSLICNYGETSEFKNECDGIGDHVKTTIKHAIIRSDLVLTSSKDYFNYAKENMTFRPENRGEHKTYKRTFYYVDSTEIVRTDNETYGKYCPGIMKARSIIGYHTGFVGMRSLSCYCSNCISGDYSDCRNDYTEKWEILHVRRETEPSCCSVHHPCLFQNVSADISTPPRPNVISTVLEQSHQLNTGTSSNALNDIPKDLCKKKLTGVSQVTMGSILPGDWVLVSLTASNYKFVRYFVANVLKVFGNYEFTVKFMKPYTYNCRFCEFVDPENDDVSDVEFDQIIGKVESPTVSRRGVKVFNVDSREWN